MLKVILKENVDNLGKIGDLVKVSDGYARNFLLPRNLVVIADEHNTAEMNHHKQAMEKKRVKVSKEATDLASRLESFSCTISRKVGDQEKLFGSVTSTDIAHALEKGGFRIDKRQIHLDEPIKQLGVFSVAVRLHPEVSSKLKVWVVQDK